MQSYNYFQPKKQTTIPKYASGARQPPKQMIGNKFSKPTAKINLDATSNGSKNSRGLSGRRNSGQVFDRLSGQGSARQNSRERGIPGARFTGSDIRKRESD